MPTAQDIYDSLITNPDYQGSHGLTREEVVEREARRRARQHANNEKALSMAVQNSAIGKLSHFIQGAFLRKARTPFDEKIINNLPEIKKFLEDIEKGLVRFEGTDDIPGWGTLMEATDQEKMRVQTGTDEDDKPLYDDISIHAVGRNFKSIRDVLKPIVDAFQSGTYPGGMADVFVENPMYKETLEGVFTEDGKIRPQYSNLWEQWKAHKKVKEYSADEEGNGDGAAQTESEGIDEEQEALNEYQDLTPARRKLVNQLQEKHYKDMSMDMIPASEVKRMINHANKAMGQTKGDKRNGFMEDFMPDADPIATEEEESPAGNLPIPDVYDGGPDGSQVIPEGQPQPEESPDAEDASLKEAAQKLLIDAGLDRFHANEFIQWMGKDTTGVTPGGMHNRQGTIPLDEVLQNTDLEEFKTRLAHYQKAHELYPEPKQGESRRGSRLGAERMQQRAEHYRKYWESEPPPAGAETASSGQPEGGLSHWTDDIQQEDMSAGVKKNIKLLESGEDEKKVFPPSPDGRADQDAYGKVLDNLDQDILDKHFSTIDTARAELGGTSTADTSDREGSSPQPEPDRASTEGGASLEPPTLKNLNDTHIAHNIKRGTTIPDRTFLIQSPIDDEGNPAENSGNIFLSKENKKEAVKRNLIKVNEDGTWTWTPDGKAKLKPAIDAMHKMTPRKGSGYANSPQPGDMVFRSATFNQLLKYLDNDQLPISFTDDDIKNEHNRTVKIRTDHNADPDVQQRADDELDSQSQAYEDGQAGDDIPNELPSYEGTFKMEEYKNDLPTRTKVDADDNPIDVPVLPQNEEGEEYNPFADRDATDINKEFKTLRDIYIAIHSQKKDENTPSLGRGEIPYFPMEEKNTAHPYNINFDKEGFSEDQVKEYNRLNSNKAVVEEYLKLFANIRKGTHNQQWQELSRRKGIAGEAANTISWAGKVWPDSDRIDELDFIPAPSTWQWFNGLHAAEEVDDDGNAKFHSLPSSLLRNQSYHAGGQEFRDWFGTNVGLVSKNVMAQQHIDENQSDFGGPDFTRARFREAWKAWRDEFPGKNIDNDNFYNWLQEKDISGNSRSQSFIADTHDDFVSDPAARPTIVPDTPDVVPDTPDVVDDEGEESELFWANRSPKFDEDHNPLDQDGKIISLDDQVQLEAEEKVQLEAEEKVRQDAIDEQARQDAIDEQARLDAVEKAQKEKLKTKIFNHEDKIGFDEQEHRDEFQQKLAGADLPTLEGWAETVDNERASARRSAQKAGVRAEEVRSKAPSPLGDERREQLIREYADTYVGLYHQSYDERRMAALREAPDKELQQEHKKLLDKLGEYQREEAGNLKSSAANNIEHAIKPLAPLQANLTRNDILMQARRLLHFQRVYGKLMKGDAEKTWKERMAEAHQLADAANMDLESKLQQDMDEATDHGDFGSSDWLQRVGEAHHETLVRRQAHRDTVSKGNALRTNVNYKPYLIAQYDYDNNFQGFHDLKTNEAVDQFNLRFDDDDHYHFHGLDAAKVKDYRRYLALQREADDDPQPGAIPEVYGPPPAPTDPELAELKEKIFGGPNGGADYKAVRDRLATLGELPGAQQLFNNKFKQDENGRFGRPVKADGSEEEVPLFYDGKSDTVGKPGWYHPESESWINPHRYDELIRHMGGPQITPYSGRVIPHGRYFYGKDKNTGESNPLESQYAFARPTEAKRRRLPSGYDDQSYYIDDTGAIAHAHNHFEAGNMQSHDQPQTTNDVVHDWNAQQMGNQAKNNPEAFINKQVVVVDSNPYSAAMPPPSIQNMWLELQALGREVGSALERREQKKQSGWEWFDNKLSKPKAVASKIAHPLSSIARDPLSARELGQEQWWSKRKELKQKYYDALDWAPLPGVSWLGRTLLALTGLGIRKPEDKVIRRIRQGYKEQALTEHLTRQAASKITVDGQKLSDVYVAPGEQKARNEDYQELKRYFIDKQKFHTNARNIAASKGKENPQDAVDAKSHGSAANRWIGLSNTLGQYDSRMPHNWKDINDMYKTHLGKVNQALPEEVEAEEWPAVMSQSSAARVSPGWGRDMSMPVEQPSGEPSKKSIPPVYEQGEQESPPVGVGSQESSQKLAIPEVYSV